MIKMFARNYSAGPLISFKTYNLNEKKVDLGCRSIFESHVYGEKTVKESKIRRWLRKKV